MKVYWNSWSKSFAQICRQKQLWQTMRKRSVKHWGLFFLQLDCWDVSFTSQRYIYLQQSSSYFKSIKIQQALYQNVQTQGYQELYMENAEFNKCCAMFMAISFLPAAQIPEGFQEVIEYAAVKNLSNETSELVKYFDKQWMKSEGPESISVFGQKHRTNNSQEAFHRSMFRLVKSAHPNVWKFIGINYCCIYKYCS